MLNPLQNHFLNSVFRAQSLFTRLTYIMFPLPHLQENTVQVSELVTELSASAFTIYLGTLYGQTTEILSISTKSLRYVDK